MEDQAVTGLNNLKEGEESGQSTSGPKPFDSSLFNNPSQDTSTTEFLVQSETEGVEEFKEGEKQSFAVDLPERSDNLNKEVCHDVSLSEEIEISDTLEAQHLSTKSKIALEDGQDKFDDKEVLQEPQSNIEEEPKQDKIIHSESKGAMNEGVHQLVTQTAEVIGKIAQGSLDGDGIYENPQSVELSKEGKHSNVIHHSAVTFKDDFSWEGDDPFLSAINMSEADRRRDAWLPSEATAKVLSSRSAIHGADYSSRPDLTMPGISFDEAQTDPLKELLIKYQHETEASKRNVLTLDQVTRDVDGLKKLVNHGCLRSAVQLTGLLLTSVGQGKGQAGMPSQNTAESLQIWFIRLALLVKLRQYTTADLESQPFRDLDKPDLYYQYYPALYPGRRGSMVPFSFRVLVAELPQFIGQHQDGMTRLYSLLTTCQKIVTNLTEGFDEYGDKCGLSEEYLNASLLLWKHRTNRVQYSVGNCLLALKDYYQSIKVFESLACEDIANSQRIRSLTGRIYLQLGDLKSAQELFNQLEHESRPEDEVGRIQILMNKGFLRMAQNMYTDAHIQFSEVLKINPNHFTAINNISVCLLYMGKLKSALTLLESLVNQDPDKYLDESILFNLCTLYELESSKSATKKQNLLCLAAKYRGDGFNTSCLKIS